MVKLKNVTYRQNYTNFNVIEKNKYNDTADIKKILNDIINKLIIKEFKNIIN